MLIILCYTVLCYLNFCLDFCINAKSISNKLLVDFKSLLV